MHVVSKKEEEAIDVAQLCSGSQMMLAGPLSCVF